MAKSGKVRIEFGAAMATSHAGGAAEGETLLVFVYAILVDGAYRGVFSSRATQRGARLGDHVFELARPDGYEGPWDPVKVAEGTGSFYRQTFAQTQQLVAERGAAVKIADSLVTDRWAFEFEAAR